MSVSETQRRAESVLRVVCDRNAFRSDEVMQGVEGEERHAHEVLDWVLRLSGDQASDALVLAALFHDVDRIANPGVGGGFKGDRESEAYAAHKRAHAERSAAVAQPLLADEGFDEATIERALFLIRHHDDPGEEIAALRDVELEWLAAADGFAFFTSIAPRLIEAEGFDRARVKAEFMLRKMPDNARDQLESHRFEDPVLERLRRAALSPPPAS